MTPFVPFTDGCQVVLHYDLFGLPCSNRLWFLNRQPPNDPGQIDNLAFGVAGWAVSWLLPYLSKDLTLVSVTAADWNSFPSPYVATETVGIAGGDLDESYSANVAIRVVFKGSSAQDFPNNSHFVAGIPHHAISENNVDVLWRDNIFEAYVALIDAAAAFGPFPAWRWMVGSSWLSNTLRSELAVARMDFVRFANDWSTQRRRRLPNP